MGKRPKKHGLPTSKRFLTFTPLPGVEGGGGGVSLGPIVFPASPCMPRARDKDSPCPHPPWPASSLPVAHARRRVGLRGFCGLPVFPLRGMCRASGRLSSPSSIASPPSPSGHTPPSCPAHMRGRDPGAGASSVLWPVAPLACGRRLGGAAETPPPASLRARYVSRGRAEEVTDSAGDYASLRARYVSRGHYTPPGSSENLFLALRVTRAG